MAEIVNLRTARKRKAREIKSRAASANRDKFGRTKAEKHRQKTQNSKDIIYLDGHKLPCTDKPESC